MAVGLAVVPVAAVNDPEQTGQAVVADSGCKTNFWMGRECTWHPGYLWPAWNTNWYDFHDLEKTFSISSKSFDKIFLTIDFLFIFQNETKVSSFYKVRTLN